MKVIDIDGKDEDMENMRNRSGGGNKGRVFVQSEGITSRAQWPEYDVKRGNQ
jgi:hypothetical protein